jgi:hypothetical protein
MSLQKKSLTELRSLAQNMGMLPRLDIGKEHLIQEIQNYAGAKIMTPPRPIEINIKNESANPLVTPEQVEKALDGFKQLGLSVTFPDKDTWEISCNTRKDSGSMYIPLFAIIGCAKELVKP